MLSVSACSGNDNDTKEPTLTASQVCDSTLDSSAVAALKRIGNTEEFEELTGSADSGEPNKFSLKRAAKTVHENPSQRNQCWVYKAGDKSGHPLIAVDFSAMNYTPKADDVSENDESENTIYPIGVYAKTHENISASIYFKCSTQDTYINASLTTAGQLSTKTTGRDLLTVLNAITRAMAKQLDCASEAALPSQVPEPKTG